MNDILINIRWSKKQRNSRQIFSFLYLLNEKIVDFEFNIDLINIDCRRYINSTTQNLIQTLIIFLWHQNLFLLFFLIFSILYQQSDVSL